MQSEALSAVFETYFRILKHCMHQISDRLVCLGNLQRKVELEILFDVMHTCTSCSKISVNCVPILWRFRRNWGGIFVGCDTYLYLCCIAGIMLIFILVHL